MNSRILFATLFLTLTSPGWADLQPYNDVEDIVVEWKENESSLPSLPKEENLVEFYVSATSAARYYIDWTTINTGTSDQVVRYVLLIKTAGGARNVSFEGIRCDTSGIRLYATVNSEGAWVMARNSEWRRIEKLRSPVQHTLAHLYFCPDFTPIKTPKEGRHALENDGHPIVKQRYE